MAIETIVVSASLALVVGFIVYSRTKFAARKEFQDYRMKASNDFRRLADVVYTAYGKTISEEVPESTDQEGNVVRADTEVKIVLENKTVAAALTEYQASLYR